MIKFSGISGKVILSNLLGLPIFFISLLLIDSGRTSLTDMQIRLMIKQAEMIAGVLTARPTGRYSRYDDKLLRPSGGRGFYLRPPLLPEDMNALLFDTKGNIIEDSRKHPPGKIVAQELYPVGQKKMQHSRYDILRQKLFSLLHNSNVTDYLIFKDDTGKVGSDFIEFQQASIGNNSAVIRVDSFGKTILSVAVPVKRLGKVLGVLKISSTNKQISEAIRKERGLLFRLFLVASIMSICVSYLLARGIARPLIRLTQNIRFSEKSGFKPNLLAKLDLVDLAERNDEIGILSKSFQNMINTLKAHFSDIEQFAADVAHELKNPLTSLKSALETLELIDNPDKKARLVSVIKQDINRIDRLIGDISKLSRIDAEMIRETNEKINLTEILKSLVDHYRQGALTHSIELTFVSEPKEIYYHGIAERLGRAFSNIIENAISFTPNDGKIDVSIIQNKHQIMITITDSGPGIPSEMLKKVFDRFYSYRPNNNKFGNHSGLGLAIVQRIIEAHNGNITAKNKKSPETGAIFTITL